MLSCVQSRCVCSRLKRNITVAINGQVSSPEQVRRVGSLCWLDAGGSSNRVPEEWDTAPRSTHAE